MQAEQKLTPGPSAVIEFFEHLFVTENEQSEGFVMADAYRLFLNFETVGAMPIEPSIGADLPKHRAVRLGAKLDGKGEAVGIEVLLREPTIWDAGARANQRRPSGPWQTSIAGVWSLSTSRIAIAVLLASNASARALTVSKLSRR